MGAVPFELVLAIAAETALLLLFPAAPLGPPPAAACAYGVGMELEMMAAILLGIRPGILLLVTAVPALLTFGPAEVNG